MAISWGSWEYSGGNGMRVGIEVDWESVDHSETSADATVKIYTENQYSYSDTQTLTYGGSLDDNQEGRTSKSFTNDDGGTAVLRDTLTYRYTYSSSSYGSSPGDRTFTASISGAFNGVTPSKSVTTAIPARPYAAPNPPTSPSITRLSDTQTRLNWANANTAGRPYTSLTIQRAVGLGGWVTHVGALGVTTSYTDATVANSRYQYQVRANNSVGSSSFLYLGIIWTAPAAPTNVTRTTSGANQVITWTNNVGYSEYNTHVYASENDGGYVLLATLGSGVTTVTHNSPAAGSRWRYIAIAQSTSGLYSAWSAPTTQTAGTILPPLAPTPISPKDVVVDPTAAQVFSWTHNPQSPDLSAQSKYQVRHRQQGVGAWVEPAAVTSGTASYTLAANTYASGTSVEWQVRTWGLHADPGPYSESAVYQNTSALAKLALLADRYTGEHEMSTSLHLVPTGSILMWALATPPIGWLVCNGSTFDAAAFPALAALLGGNTLPDLRDRVPVGVSATKAARSVGGAATVTLTANEMPSHQHAGVDHLHGSNTMQKTANASGSASDNGGASVTQGTASGRFIAPQTFTTGAADRALTTGLTGGGAAFSIQNPYVALNFIIRAA